MTVTEAPTRLPSGDAPEPLYQGWRSTRAKLGLLVPLNLVLSVWYFSWLLRPERVGNAVLYGLLILCEVFNLVQAVGFWWTALRARAPRPVEPLPGLPRVDVLIPVYNEPVKVVEPTVAAAMRMTGADVNVVLCDDGSSGEMAALARRLGAGYLTREHHEGAKAGNINNALRHTNAPYVAVFDCDHVPASNFLARTLGHFAQPEIALVQTPQYYANASSNRMAAAAWSQQALFFGIIARGKDASDAMFCCGTNVVFRRSALDSVGGIPEHSVTEDFEVSIHLQERGWKAAYVPEILASGLGPEDMASYVSQQSRWARGCLAAVSTAARARLPWRRKAHFLLSSMYFLTGWTYLLYMSLPVVRIFDGGQALSGTTADQFLAHFAPYFCFSLFTVAVAGAGRYTFAAFALTEASYWIHVSATIRSLLRRPARFVVTPKQGRSGRQLRPVIPGLAAVTALAAAAVAGLSRNLSPAILNNVAFAGLHIIVILVGIWPALSGSRPAREVVDLRQPLLESSPT